METKVINLRDGKWMITLVKLLTKYVQAQPMELVKSPENWLCISGGVCARYIYLFVYQMIDHISFQEGT